ncbi:hypothetical protein [Glaciihabitans sp. dw_435]|uniref:hypothetical protein n=1 Tax=Glaciihabitans sp. dw_435 TaxID=2720081 RepID=UPI0021020855|nr:hypothetical protein [Glaciihabitans sp. dw_435]
MNVEGMSDEEKRHDQLTTAPKADESDAAPRIDITEKPDGVTRIDVREDAKYRPGGTDDTDIDES